ncbi:Amidase [Rhodovastum atsumiense]|uniref:Amidase n=1 Tax=Rhodovastum atsumiense TaxID=504468 RepID=A0A5M6IXW6_9PROT|nr:amidase [Rhodovastum atsumiense]KAA5613200.1 amidase [Rhodovastum atsumiense]CAH2600648.1 Amidase [Rhodovastum atsumiense]
MTAPWWLTASGAARAFSRRLVSPVELVQALLDRIAALDPHLHGFVRVDAEAALAAARAAAEEIAAGRVRGPLHGVPVGIEDLIDIAGLPTTCASRLRLDHVASADAACVAKLRAAGAILLGKLTTHEFGLAGPDADGPFPSARNPWSPAHHAGGAGVGLAAGLFPLAVAADHAGGVRHPAAACGVVGLKPSAGLVSRRGVVPVSFTCGQVGPMARTVADVALLLDALAGHDPLDPGSVVPPRRNFAAMLGRGAAGLRIGFVRHFHERDLTADAATAAALEQVLRTLAQEGAEAREVTLPPLADFTVVGGVLTAGEAWAVHQPWLRARPGEYGRPARRFLMTGAFLGAGDYVAAQSRRRHLITAVEAVLREVDVLLCAALPEPAGASCDALMPFNVTGHPALTMPAGLSPSGMPVSVQFVGRYFEEATLLRAAGAWERAAGTDALHPSSA